MKKYLALQILTMLIALICPPQGIEPGSDTYAAYDTSNFSSKFKLASKPLFADSADLADMAGSINSADMTDSTDSADPAGEDIEIVLSFAGDCTIGTDDKFDYIYSFPYRLDKVGNDFSYFFRGVRQVFENDDLTLVNLETTFTEASKRAEKKFCFKGLPSYAKILSEGYIEMVNLSNNHIYDYFETGFRDTLQALDSENIKYCGEGEIACFEVKGAVVASLGYTGWNTSFMDEIKNDLSRVRKNADIVIVSFHWGSEYSFYPNSIQKLLARLCIDNGADVVVGHHPHVMQGIERYKDGVIAYSLGNFCFGGNRNPKDKDTFILQVIFPFIDGKADRSEIAIFPCSLSSVSWINDYQPTILEGDKSENVLKRLFKYSSELEWGIDRSDIITR